MNLPARRGLALTIIGPILMLVLAPAVLGIGIWRGVVAGNAGLDHYSWMDVGQTAQISGVGSQSIVVSDNGASSSVDCSVDGPSGPVDIYPVSYGDGSIAASSYLEIAEFDPDVPGAYQVDCAADQVKVLPTQVLDDADNAFGLRMLIGFAAAGVCFAIGLTLLIVGIVKLVNSANDRRRALWPQAGYGYGYTGGYGYPQQAPPTGDPDDPYARP
ncbi:hypothetical protein [Flexivirga alba]|uniref:Uncharacterized protein n=1 Tax=Flexivirga alba TaxID=702742 RepID=A0ABW2AB27_9MICO